MPGMIISLLVGSYCLLDTFSFPPDQTQETEWVEFICSGLSFSELECVVSSSHSRLPLSLMERKKDLYRVMNLMLNQKSKVSQINHPLQLPFCPLTTKRAWSAQSDAGQWKSCDPLE